MSQKLAFPINHATITACYQEDAPGYYNEWDSGGHFGIDMTGWYNPFYASGVGKVIAVGGSATAGVGYYAVIRYNDVQGKDKYYGDLIVRYFHLESKPNLTPGQDVGLNTIIGKYSNTGAWHASMGLHLHVEVDTDLTYWDYTPTLTGASGGLKAGLRGSGDTTVNPLLVFQRKLSSPEEQTVTYSQSYDKQGNEYINVNRVNSIGTFR